MQAHLMQSILGLQLLALGILGVAIHSQAIPIEGLPQTSHDWPNATLVLLKDSMYARCLDGSPGGFYILHSRDPNLSNTWTFSLEGGGECVGKDDCLARASSQLGSSEKWAESMLLGQFQFPSKVWNPKFWGANHVFIKYCTGDLHSGQRWNPSKASFGLRFAGHEIVKETLQYLINHNQLNDAETVLWSGDSAGGIGAFLHIQYVSELLSNARILPAPIGGFYFPAHAFKGSGSQPVAVDFSEQSWKQHTALWDSYLPPACADVEPNPHLCMLANVSYHHMNVPAFIVEAQTDKVVMMLHDGVDPNAKAQGDLLNYMGEWSHNMTSALSAARLSVPGTGYFNPACWMHCSFGGTPKIAGLDFLHAFMSWMDGEDSLFADDCGVDCNSSCPVNP